MLDTVAIMLSSDSFVIKYPDRFSPNAKSLYEYRTGRGTHKAIYNPTQAEKLMGYKPRLTLHRAAAAGGAVQLKVEFSAPKLLFGNNFEEMATSDFSSVLERLDGTLYDMGILVKRPRLSQTPVSAIHYGKNILLERTTPCWLLLRQLEGHDLNGRLDLARVDFRNGGLAVKYHANGHELALYDKVKDLEQAQKFGDKRGLEHDYQPQLDLFVSTPEKPEVLRMEARLTRRKLKTLLPNLGITTPLTLEALFDATTARAVLLHYWREITNGLYAQQVDTGSIETLLQNIRMVFPRKRIGTMLALASFARAVQEMGWRGARVTLEMKPALFYRYRKDMNALAKQSVSPRHTVLAAVKEELQDFIPLTRAELGLIGGRA